jgi:hypothetical protein
MPTETMALTDGHLRAERTWQRAGLADRLGRLHHPHHHWCGDQMSRHHRRAVQRLARLHNRPGRGDCCWRWQGCGRHWLPRLAPTPRSRLCRASARTAARSLPTRSTSPRGPHADHNGVGARLPLLSCCCSPGSRPLGGRRMLRHKHPDMSWCSRGTSVPAAHLSRAPRARYTCRSRVGTTRSSSRSHRSPGSLRLPLARDRMGAHESPEAIQCQPTRPTPLVNDFVTGQKGRAIRREVEVINNSRESPQPRADAPRLATCRDPYGTSELWHIFGTGSR